MRQLKQIYFFQNHSLVKFGPVWAWYLLYCISITSFIYNAMKIMLQVQKEKLMYVRKGLYLEYEIFTMVPVSYMASYQC